MRCTPVGSRVLVLAAASAALMAAQPAQASSVSDFWSSVASGAGSQVGGVVAGYALSALGLSGASQEDADLKEIEQLLTAIDSELAQLVNEVQALECLTAQDQTTLTNSIKNIQGLYDTYSNWVADSPTVPCWEQSDDSGNVCFGQSGIKTWLDETTDPANGVDAALDAIADVMIQAGNTGVIYECTQTITNNYNDNKTDGPAQHVFDDVYYSQVQQLTNYYYGVQAQGAALLSEAYHLQACLSLGASECLFNGQSATGAASPGLTDATPSNPGVICENAAPGSQAAADCMNAQSIVAKTYDTIETQLIQAGAPYTNDVVGKAWTGDAVFAKSLEDFTNNATANGDKVQSTPCATPLTSAAPCGFTVGAYNLAPPNNHAIGYGGYDYWTYPSAGDLKDLLTTYNNETSGTTSSTLGAWMNSVGFTTAQDKIVLSPSTGSNFGTTTICFMDTSIARSASKQPWCDNGGAAGTNALVKQGKSGGCGGACYFADYSQADFTGSSVASDFYPLSMTWYDDYGNTYDWGTKPGWLSDEQGNTKFHHFHWPAFDLTDLGAGWCTVREKGTAPQDNKNPGGILSMCGSDLQTWLDGVLQNPDVTFRVRMAKRDTTLLGADRNRNDGANPRLSLMGRGGIGRQVIAVEFDQELIQRFLDDGPLGRATLILTIAENEGHWGRRGQLVTVRPLADTFWEGNGNLAADERGSGRGATWSCAIDADIADDVKACEVAWSERIWRGKGIAELHDDGLLGEAAWDVTEDVADGITSWTIQKSGRRRGGNVHYYSREGARALLDTGLAPTLLLEH